MRSMVMFNDDNANNDINHLNHTNHINHINSINYTNSINAFCHPERSEGSEILRHLAPQNDKEGMSS
jgi:hypothetical protein